MNYFEGRETIKTSLIYSNFEKSIKDVLDKFNLKSVDYDLKEFDKYTDLELPCVKLVKINFVTEGAGVTNSSKISIAISAYVIYKNNKNNYIDDIVDELLQNFNNKSFMNTANGFALKASVVNCNYSNPLKIKEHRVAEIEFEILTIT